jgi:phosphatidylglycerophosphate synthase
MDFSNIFVILAIGAVAVVLGMGLWNMMRGGSPSRSQNLMRWRVLLQAVAIAVILLTLWIAGR